MNQEDALKELKIRKFDIVSSYLNTDNFYDKNNTMKTHHMPNTHRKEHRMKILHMKKPHHLI